MMKYTNQGVYKENIRDVTSRSHCTQNEGKKETHFSQTIFFQGLQSNSNKSCILDHSKASDTHLEQRPYFLKWKLHIQKLQGTISLPISSLQKNKTKNSISLLIFQKLPCSASLDGEQNMVRDFVLKFCQFQKLPVFFYTEMVWIFS